MKEGVSNQLSLTSTPIKIIANDENAKLPKAIQSNPSSKQGYNQSGNAEIMKNFQVNSFKPIAPSPNKPQQIPIAARPTQNASNRPMNNPQSTQKPSNNGQMNILTAAQLEQQQKQYLLKQQYQQQLATYQKLQQQQKQLQQQHYQQQNMYANTGITQSLAQKLITNAMKQSQQQTHNNQSIASLAQNNTNNNGNIVNMNSQIPPHILQYLQSNNDLKKNIQMIQPKKQANDKFITPVSSFNQKPIRAEQPQTKTQALASNQQAPIRLVMPNTQNNVANAPQNTASSTAPTIFSATTTPDGQIIFKTVKPTAATNAALVAYQQQQMLQQQTKTPSNQAPLIPNSKVPIPAQANSQQVFNGIQQQEFLQQKLHQETLKYQKLKKKCDELDNKPNQRSINEAQPNQNQFLKNIVTTEIEKMNEDAKKTLQPMISNVNDEIKGTMNFDELIKASTMYQQANESNSFNKTPQQQQNNIKQINQNSASPAKTKRRGRPRLYAVNPITGRSMKGHLLDKTSSKNTPSPKQNLAIQTAKENNKPPIYPSPTSSISSCPQNESQQIKEPFVVHTEQPDQVIEIDLNSQNEDENVNDRSELSYSSESEDEGQSVQKDETLPHQNQNKDTTNNSDKENNHEINVQNETVRETVTKNVLANEPQVMMVQEPQINNLSLKRVESSPPSPSSSASTSKSRISSRSSSSSSSTSLTSSLKRRSNEEILETVRNMSKFPPVVPDDTVLTHVIEGFVLKESSNPFPVKKSDSLSNQKNYTQNLDREILNLYLEKIQDSRKKMQESLEKSFEFIQPTVQPQCSPPHDNKPKSNSPPKSTSTPSNRKSIEAQNVQNLCNYTSPMYSPYFSQNNDEQMQKAWKNHDTSAQNSLYVTNGFKKLRKSVENPLPSNYENENRNSISFSGETNNIQMPLMNFSSLQYPSQQPAAISTSPKPCQMPSNNHLNSSKNSIENEIPSGDPTEWTCDDVFYFVKLVAGVTVAELFLLQEVDGSALSLIRDDHLVNTMHIKLGPALKIMSKFNELKTKFSNNMSS